MKNIKTYAFISVFLLAVLVLPNFSSAATAEEIQVQINALMAQIKELQAQLAQQQSVAQGWCHDFNVNLKIGDSGLEVQSLHAALSADQGAPIEVNMASKEFTEETTSAVTGFQQKYKDEILKPFGLKYGTGFVGKFTRLKLNNLYGCSVSQGPTSTSESSTAVPAITSLATTMPPIFTSSIKITVQDQNIVCITAPCGILTNAKVAVYNSAGSYIGTKDTSGGSAVFENLPEGIYTAVASAEGYEDNKAEFKIAANVGGYLTIYLKKKISISFLTVLSPNGGEVWTKGTIQTIKWQDNTPSSSLTPKYYDIKLVSYYQPCTGEVCPAYPYIALEPYTIAKSVSGNSYSWGVGKIVDLYDGLAPDGSYTVQICQSNTNTCDSSDSYFKIVSTSTNNPPVINGFPAIPLDIKIGQSVSFSWSANDANGDNLSWSVSWGDGTGEASTCQSPNPKNQQGWIFKTSHIWSKAGTYVVNATVNDCNGGSDINSFNINVLGTTISSLTVLSPNGGEVWTKGTIQTIKWQDNTPSSSLTPKYYDIKLVTYYPPCTGEVCPAYPYIAPYTIAKSVLGSSYGWLVGNILDTLGKIFYDGNTVPDGPYTIQICQTGSTTCDSSDSYFKIVSTSTNNSLNVLYPNGGISMPQTGSLMASAKIVSSKTSGTLSWYLIGEKSGYKRLVTVQNFSPTSSNNTAYATIDFPTSTPVGSDYKIKVDWTSSDGLEGLIDTSDNFFSITTLAPTIVISPNGGEQWQIGTTQTIKWTTQSGVSVLVDLYKGNIFVKRLSNGYVSGSFLSVNVGSDLAVGNDYKIKIQTPTASIYDYSDASFSIAAATTTPSITVLSPNGGENYKVGDIVQIRWKSQGITGKVGVYIFDNRIFGSGSTNYVSFPSMDSLEIPVEQGYYNWTIPSLSILPNGNGDGKNYKISISSRDNTNIYDSSDSSFSIVAAGTNLPNLSVSLDASTPLSTTWTAGSMNVPATVLKFTTMYEGINLQSIALQFDGSNLGAVQKYTVWDGSTKIGESSFGNSSNSNIIFSSPVSIPVDYVKKLTIKVDLAQVGIAQPAQTGDTVVINYDGDNWQMTKGIGQTSGAIIYSSTKTDTAANKITLSSNSTTTSTSATNSTQTASILSAIQDILTQLTNLLKK